MEEREEREESEARALLFDTALVPASNSARIARARAFGVSRHCAWFNGGASVVFVVVVAAPGVLVTVCLVPVAGVEGPAGEVGGGVMGAPPLSLTAPSLPPRRGRGRGRWR